MFYLTEISEITRLVFDIECWMQQTGISLSDVYKADWRSNNIYYEMSADLLSRERERERERGLLRPEAPTHRPVLGTEQRDERDFSTHLPRHFLTTPSRDINCKWWTLTTFPWMVMRVPGGPSPACCLPGVTRPGPCSACSALSQLMWWDQGENLSLLHLHTNTTTVYTVRRHTLHSLYSETKSSHYWQWWDDKLQCYCVQTS